MNLFLNISTVDSEIAPGRYPPGAYALNVINQRASAPPADRCFQVAANWIQCDSIGLSKSRNRGIDALGDAQGAVVIIGDNDVDYAPEFDAAVRAAYEAHPEADVILFKVKTPDGADFKQYPPTVRRCGLRSVMRACSIEISFRRDSIRRAGIRFDERFGLGAVHKTGEDIIFLADCVRKGLVVLFVPVTICTHPAESSGAVHSEDILRAKGAMFRRIFGRFGVLVSIAYCLKKARAATANGLLRSLYLSASSALRSFDNGRT